MRKTPICPPFHHLRANETCTEKSAASEALLSALSVAYPSTDPANPHLITLPHTSRLYKTLLQGGHFSHSTRTIELAPRFSPRDFAVRFVQRVGRANTIAMAQGDGAFVVAALCEQLAEHPAEEVAERAEVKGWFDKKMRKEIENAGGKGVKVLLESLERL